VYDLELDVFLTSRDVMFSKNKFPYVETQSLASELSDTKPNSFVPWNNVDNTGEIEIV